MGRSKKDVQLSSDEDEDFDFGDAAADDLASLAAPARGSRRAKRRRSSSGHSSDSSFGGGGDDDDDDDDQPFAWAYDSDGFGDDADRERVLQMPEVEREELIFQRLEERQMKKSLWELNREMRRKRRGERAGASSAKKLSRAEREREREKERRRAEQRRGMSKADRRADALDDLRARRAGKHAGSRRGVAGAYGSSDSEGSFGSESDSGSWGGRGGGGGGRRRRRRRSSDEWGGSDAGSDSFDPELEPEEAERRRAERARLDAEATNDQLRSVFLSRNRLDMWCNEPFFDATVIGFFARVNVGRSKDATARYQLAEIVAVEQVTSRVPAKADDPHGPQVPAKYRIVRNTTDKVLALRAQGHSRNFRMVFVSSQPPTDEELAMWRGRRAAAGEPVVRCRDVEAKLRDKAAAANFNYTDAVVQAQIERRVAEGRGVPQVLATRRHDAAEKVRDIESRITAANAAGQDTAPLEAELEAAREAYDRAEADVVNEREKVAKEAREVVVINRRNRNLNERRLRLAKAETEAAKMERLEEEDPSLRRRCDPAIQWTTRKARKDEADRKAREERERREREARGEGDAAAEDEKSAGDSDTVGGEDATQDPDAGEEDNDDDLFDPKSPRTASAHKSEKHIANNAPARSAPGGLLGFDIDIDIDTLIAKPRGPAQKSRVVGMDIGFVGDRDTPANVLSLDEYFKRATS